MRPTASLCPQDIKEALNRYVHKGYEPGSFLLAVLSNDLMGAFNRADDGNLEAMPHIMAYVYNEIPSNVHGSREKVKAFLENHPAHREQAEGEV